MIGFIFSSNFLLGLNFHFLNPHQPRIAKPTTTATTITMIMVVLFIPVVLLPELAASAEAEVLSVLETVVTRLTVV